MFILFSLYKKWKTCWKVFLSVKKINFSHLVLYLNANIGDNQIICMKLPLLFCVVCSEWQLAPQWIAPRRPSYLFQWQMKQMKSASSVIEKTFLSVNCKKQCFVKVQFSHSVSQRQYWWDFLFFRIAFNVLLGNRPCHSFYPGKKGDCIVFKH